MSVRRATQGAEDRFLVLYQHARSGSTLARNASAVLAGASGWWSLRARPYRGWVPEAGPRALPPDSPRQDGKDGAISIEGEGIALFAVLHGFLFASGVGIGSVSLRPCQSLVTYPAPLGGGLPVFANAAARRTCSTSGIIAAASVISLFHDLPAIE